MNDAALQLARLVPFNPEASVLTVLCRRSDYSAGRIAHAIEDCNANLINLNVTSDTPGDDMVAVEIRVDRKNTAAIARSLARYDYIVLGHDSHDDVIDETGRNRVAELLRYLDI